MPKPLPSFIIELTDLLSPLGEVRIKRMFGGFGIYLRDLFIGIVDDGRLYLKVDEQTKSAFEARDLAPFTIEHRGRMMSMAYHLAPEEALDSSIKMKPWAMLALQAAQRAATAKSPKKKSPAYRKP